MEIRERLEIEMTPEERAIHEMVTTFISALNQQGYSAVMIFGRNLPDDPASVTASVKYTRSLTRDGLVTLMTALNNHATSILEDT